MLYKSCFLELERIKIICINFNGKNCFGFRTIRFSNSLLERIMFENRGVTVSALEATFIKRSELTCRQKEPSADKKNSFTA